MPWQTRVTVAAFVTALLVVLVSRRVLRAPPTLGPWLEERGFRLQRMEPRWLTRGPFPDIRPAGVQHSGWLVYFLARERSGKVVSGWVWLPPRWRWASPEHWRLHLEPGVVSKPGGIGTPLFMSMLATAAAAVLLVVYAIVQQHQ
jgi:hypothetical protein